MQAIVVVPCATAARIMRIVVSISGEPWSTWGSRCEWVSMMFAGGFLDFVLNYWAAGADNELYTRVFRVDSMWNWAESSSRKVN